MQPDLSVIFGMNPAAAIAYAKSKGFAITWNWQEMLDDAHQRAFTVAKVARLDVLQDIKDALLSAKQEGKTFKQFADELTPILQSKGWWGKKVVVGGDGGAEVVQEGSLHRLRTIFQTNMQSAYMAARMQEMQDSTATHPYWEYVAVMDGRTRPSHRAMNGRVLLAADPFWITGFPPNGFNCRCRVKPLSRAAVRRSGTDVESSAGKLRTITDESGVDKRTGEVMTAKRTGMKVTDESGKTVFFAPDAGFNAAPVGTGWMHDMLVMRAKRLLGERSANRLLKSRGIDATSGIADLSALADYLLRAASQQEIK